MRAHLDLLADTTALEFGDSLAGSVCAHHLALLGATVLLAEPADGCSLRRFGATQAGRDGPLFEAFGRGRVAVDLEDVFGDRLARRTDIVILPVRDDVLAGLPDAMSRDAGGDTIAVDFREFGGAQLTESAAQAAFGFSAFLGRAGEPPLRVGFEMIGYSAGVLATQAVVAAIAHLEDHGVGQLIRVPLSRVAANILNNVITASIEPDQDVGFSRAWASAPYVGVPCSDGEVEFLFYGPASETGWRAFCVRIGLQDLADDPGFPTSFARTYRSGELTARLAPATRKFSRDALLKILWDEGAMAVPRQHPAEAAKSGQAVANGISVAFGDGTGRLAVASPWQLDGERAAIPHDGGA